MKMPVLFFLQKACSRMHCMRRGSGKSRQRIRFVVRDRTVIVKTKQYLEERCSMKVEVEELEALVA